MQKVTKNSLQAAGAVFAAVGVGLWLLKLPVVFVYLGAISVTTLVFYGYDKRQAVRNGSRIPEVVLHVLALIGGTVGALLGQMVFRHKTRKLSFRAVFVATVLVQIAAVCAWFYWRSRD